MEPLYFPRPPTLPVGAIVDTLQVNSLTPFSVIVSDGTDQITSLTPTAAKQVLISNGVGVAPSIRALALSDFPNDIPTSQLLVGSGTYSTPVNCKSILVEVVGGGGGGASSLVTAKCGGGGGAGGYCRAILAPGTYSFSVGAGGTGATASGAIPATAGGTSTFDGLTSTGGQPGINGTTSNNGSGGLGGTFTAGSGIFGFAGGGGAAGNIDNSGQGGDTFYGPQTRGQVSNLATVGDNGNGYGGGAGSGVKQGAGGNGAIGLVRVNEFYV
jgi:hypothetical protein